MNVFSTREIIPGKKWAVCNIFGVAVAYTSQSLEAELIATRLSDCFEDAVAECKTNWVLDEIYQKFDRGRV